MCVFLKPKNQKEETYKITDEAYLGSGVLINSNFLNGLNIKEAQKEIELLELRAAMIQTYSITAVG